MAAVEVIAPSPGRLATRVVVGAALAAVAVAAVWAGGPAFTTLIAAAALLMNTEWALMHGIRRGFRLAGLVALACTAAVGTYIGAADGIAVLAASAGLLGLFMRGFDRGRAFWIASGLLYCGLPMLALLWLRAQPAGVALTTATFVIVWATDIGAFFAGRAFGGPKLAPAISPNKTWAGAAGGILAAAFVALAAAGLMPHGLGSLDLKLISATYARPLLAGVVLAVVAILGDLFESWLKRRAGVKDSGTILPGHGGVMDRIDGLVPVAVVVAAAVAVGL